MKEQIPFKDDLGYGHIVEGQVFRDLGGNFEIVRPYTDEVADFYLQMLHEDKKIVHKPNRNKFSKRRRKG